MTLNRAIAWTAAAVAALTVTWAVLTGISVSQVQPRWSPVDYLRWVASPDAVFVLNYLNAVALTVAAMLLFALLGRFFSDQHPTASALAMVFVPAYGVLNLFCYALQLRVAPMEAREALLRPEQQFFAFQLVQANATTLAGFANGLAYAILAVPSAIFGILLAKDCGPWSGRFLAFSGLLSALGFGGYLAGSAFLASGMLWGGIVFLIAALFLFWEFRREFTTAPS